MPTYEYKCNCGWSGDMHSSVEDMDAQKCPECGKKLQRVFTLTKDIRIPPSMRAC